MNKQQFKSINNPSHLRPDFSIHRSFLIAVKSLIFLFLWAAPALGQQGIWHYVTTITEGVKFYLGFDRRINPAGNILIWEKMLTKDGTQLVSFVEWDCRLKNRRTLQTTVYNPDQTIKGTVKQPEWSPVIPDSSSALLYQQICRPPTAVSIIEITASATELRAAPDLLAPIVRKAGQGERFRLLTNTGIGGWYNIVDPQTEQDYWLTDDNFRISAPPQPAAGRKTSTAVLSAAPPGSAETAPRAKPAKLVKTKNRKRP